MDSSSIRQTDPNSDLEVGDQNEKGICLNCETRLMGDFCYLCGQKSDVKPFTFRTLISHFYQSYRKIDSEIRNTFLALLFRPGDFCREYLAGKRKPYTDPVKYFFFCFVFQITLFGFVRYFSNNPDIDEAAKISAWMQILILASVFFWAISYTIVFRRAGFNLAENMVCMLFVTSESRIFSVIVQLIMLPFAAWLEYEKAIREVLSLLVVFVYVIYFSRQFYRLSLTAAVLKNLLVFLIFLILFIPFFFLEIIVVMIAQTISRQ